MTFARPIQGYSHQKIRVTIDQNLVFRDQLLPFDGRKENPLLEDDCNHGNWRFRAMAVSDILKHGLRSRNSQNIAVFNINTRLGLCLKTTAGAACSLHFDSHFTRHSK